MDNSVEIFNCPLCSFCETGLDRLVKHIRQHIKPEPKSSSNTSPGQTNAVGDQPITPRDHAETNQKDLHLDDYINNLSSKEAPPTINLFSGPDSAMETTSPSTTISSDTAVWPNIKVTNPQSVAPTKVSSKSQQSAATETMPSRHNNNTEVPPQQMQISPPSSLPPPHSVMYMRKEAPKYVQIHPREHFNQQKSPYSHPHYLNKQYIHPAEHYVPIAPAKVNKFQEGKPMQLDMHEVFRRGSPGAPKHHQNMQFVPPHNPRNMVPMNGRPSPPDMHSTYPVRPNFHPTQQQQYPVHSPPQGGNTHHQHQPTQVQYQQQQRGPAMDTQMQSRVQSRISGMQNIELPNVGFPNNGTVLLNPEQLLKMSGNITSLDQLAGLLVVPLKKTAEIAIQTDPVEFHNTKSRENSSITCGVQTDLRMQYISEESQRTTVPVLDSIRSTDNLFECLICGEEFVSDQHIQDHVSSMHKHVCENCFHASTSLPEHQSHLTECGKCDAELLCMACNNSFPSIKKLNQHRIKVHSVRMPFRCGICNMPFETHDAVMHHMATHDNDVPEFKCRYCRKVFQSAEALSKHFQRHKQVDVEHQCRFCRKSFNTDKLLRDHIGIAHVIKEIDDPPFRSNGHHTNHKPSATSITGSQNLNRMYFLCQHCDLAFKNKDLLSRHVNICSKNGSLDVTCFVCDVCKEFYDSENSRKMHLKNDHRRQNGYRCPKCSKVYRTWTRLKFHTKQQHLKKNCPDCDVVFTKEHVLRKHQEDVHGKTSSHNGERVYKCSDCSLSLYTLTDLTVHRRTLHPERKSMKTADQSSGATMLSFIDNPENESNDVIGDSTSNNQMDEPSLLSQPSPTTNDRDPAFLCDRCNSTFADEKRLKNHLGLTHGERPFVCQICNKRFQYSSQIVWHMKNHNNRGSSALTKTSNKLWKGKTTLTSKFKPKSTINLSSFVCQFCGARFRQEKLLKNHKGAVHKIKLFNCHICAAKYGHSTELIWHVRTCKAKFMRVNPGSSLPENNEVMSSQSACKDEVYDGDDNDGIADGDVSGLKSLPSPTHNELEDMEMPASNIQLSKEEAEELLRNDPEFDHGRGEYTCPLCKKSTKSITGMKTHYGRVHGIWGKESSHKYAGGRKVTIWPCRNCDQEFQSFDEIRSHCLDLHGLTVTKEELDFETRQEFIPEKNLSKTSLYKCQTCGVSFDNSKSIRVHTFKKHGIILNDSSLKESENANPSMATPTSSKTKVEASNPDDITEDELRYKCPGCKSQFRTTKALRVHSFKRHGVILSKQEMNRSKKWVATNVTNHNYTSAANNPNKGRDLIESPNPCDKCGRVFGNYRALFTHYRQAHRITDPNHVFVPRKPSRTELSIQTFSDPPASEAQHVAATTPPVATKQSPGVADSVDCPKCSRIFTNHKSFVAHLYSAHKVSKDQYSIYWPNGIPVLPRESSACPTCNKECLDERAMRIHMFKAHGTHYRDYAQDQESKSSLASPNDMVSMVNSSFIDTPDDSKLTGSTCCVCSQSCKSRRALIAHELSFHNIRWENGKRILPDKAKPISFPGDSLNGESVTMVNDSKWDSQEQPSPSTASTLTSNKPFVCSLCEASYHNRRAITTHLCRVHKYRKDDVQAYFAQHFATDESPTMPPFVDSSDVNSIVESNGVNGNEAEGDEPISAVLDDEAIGDSGGDTDEKTTFDMLDTDATQDTDDPSEALVIDENGEEDSSVETKTFDLVDAAGGNVLPEE